MKVLDDLAYAKKELKLADHMAYVTYKLLGDRRIVLSIIEHICNALSTSVNSFLEHERFLKKVYHIPDDSKLRMRFFLRDYATELGLDLDDENMLIRLEDMRDLNKRSNYNLQRGDSFFFVNDGFRVETIDLKMVKKYLRQSKNVVEIIEKAVKTNDSGDKLQY